MSLVEKSLYEIVHKRILKNSFSFIKKWICGSVTVSHHHISHGFTNTLLSGNPPVAFITTGG
jgi:hypothetical protein